MLINDAPVYTIDAHDAPTSVWNSNSIDYTPSTDTVVTSSSFCSARILAMPGLIL